MTSATKKICELEKQDVLFIKKCSKCQVVKSFDLFYRDKSTKSGKASWCKECCRAYHQSDKGKASYKTYRRSEKGKAYGKDYRQTEKDKAARKEYSQSEKGRTAQKKHSQTEKFRIAQIKYDQSEKGKISQKRAGQSNKGKITHRKYDQSEKGKEVKKRFRQSEKGKLHSIVSNFQRRNKSYISKEILEKVLSIYGLSCIYCNNELDYYSDDPHFKLTFDHIIPIVKGGTNDLNNLVPACKFHNVQKSSRDLKYYVKTYFLDSIYEIFERLSLGNLVIKGIQ